MSQQSVLDVQDLYVTFHQDKKSAELVKGVSFSVAPGECLGILGESGSGKSMTAKAMLGLLDRSFEVRGKVFFQGESLLEKDADALRRLRGSRICMVLQNPMSCFDPLYRIGAQMAETFQEHTDWSSAEIRAKSIEVLKLMKIRDPEDVLRKYPHQMSGGMLQRVMIGLALHAAFADHRRRANDSHRLHQPVCHHAGIPAHQAARGSLHDLHLA